MIVEENRLAQALVEKSEPLFRILSTKEINPNQLHILLIAFKHSDRLLIYAKNNIQDSYQFLHEYKISCRSGVLGPKKKEGDKQVPEGFYYINRFNPRSKYHLSLGLNYPNDFDIQNGYTGSHIFIHGGIESQGCIPITDDHIKEVYILAHWAYQAGQHLIPVYIFPFEMTEENLNVYKSTVHAQTLAFWETLQEGYNIFHQTNRELNLKIENGKYHISG